MTKYVLLYVGGTAPETHEDGEKVMAAWGAWYSHAAEKIVDAGNAFGNSFAVRADAPRQRCQRLLHRQRG